jgi:signal transduction histidine kinase
VAIENANLYGALREGVRVRDEFMSAAAHELRTPVTTIKGWAELLVRMGKRDDMERRALEVIDTQTDRITALLNDLLAVVRMRPGPPTLEKVRFDLSAITRDVVARVARTTEIHQITFQAAELLPVEADMNLVGEVLAHLLENAMRYSPAGGAIEVRAVRHSSEAVVSVHDYGVGIDAARQAHVFEPFYEPVPAGVPGYLGIVSLGLHLSKQIVEAHGGRIWFESTPGHGSTFFFSLSVAAPPA